MRKVFCIVIGFFKYRGKTPVFLQKLHRPSNFILSHHFIIIQLIFYFFSSLSTSTTYENSFIMDLPCRLYQTVCKAAVESQLFLMCGGKFQEMLFYF